MEALLQMLFDVGTVQASSKADGPWTLQAPALDLQLVPTTLNGVLQARLDALPGAERMSLQQASVLGLAFWRDTLAELDAATRALATGDLSVRAVVTRDDEIGRVADSFNRMADHLEAQMALVRAHEAWLQEILDGLPDGVRVIRVADKKVVLANRAFCQQTGWPLEEILDRPCHRSSHDRAEPCAATLVICPPVSYTHLTLPTSDLV